MDRFSRDDVIALASTPRRFCVSLFLPTHRSAPDSRPVAPEDVIRWKNLVREADDRLRASRVDPTDAAAALEPARALLDDAPFWQYQSDGLAAFAAPDLFRTYRVPLSLRELVVVAPTAHVAPLVPLLADGDRFSILALGQNHVRLFDGSRTEAIEVEVAGMPRSLQEALRFDDPQKQLQYHTAAPRQSGKGAAVFHGQGVGTDETKTNVLRFCRQVDRALGPALQRDGRPLVLAAVQSVAAIYRQANTYPHLLEAIVAGNPEAWSGQELHARAWPLIEAGFVARRHAAARRFEEARTSGKAIAGVRQVLPAAVDGRVDVLFVAESEQRWGVVSDEGRTIELHEAPEIGDEDLLNAAVAHTMRGSGVVYAVPRDEMPDRAALAALLRY